VLREPRRGAAGPLLAKQATDLVGHPGRAVVLLVPAMLTADFFCEVLAIGGMVAFSGVTLVVVFMALAALVVCFEGPTLPKLDSWADEVTTRVAKAAWYANGHLIRQPYGPEMLEP